MYASYNWRYEAMAQSTRGVIVAAESQRAGVARLIAEIRDAHRDDMERPLLKAVSLLNQCRAQSSATLVVEVGSAPCWQTSLLAQIGGAGMELPRTAECQRIPL